jgi:uncharacterized protein (DUF58 family)
MSDDDNIYRVDARDLIGLRGRALRLKPARALAARSALAGAHRSRFRGRGMDYRESRHYQPGDDIRNMDWRVTARAGDAHVKVFDEERERPVVVLADFGPSMFFASRGVFKSVLAARLAALIGWSAVSRGDRIGALIFNGEHRELPPTGGRRGQMRLIRALVEAGSPEQGLHEAAPSAGLTHALTRLGRVARPGSLVFLLSDFYTMDSETAHHLTRLARHSDLSALQIVDPLELAPPPPGRYAIGNGRHTGVIDTGNRSERERYARHFERHHAAVSALIEGNGIALLQCRTDDDPAERLGAMLAARRPGGRGEGRAPDTKRDDRGATGAAGATVRGAGMP